MHGRRRSNKNIPTTRFSLLLLENGEFFLDVSILLIFFYSLKVRLLKLNSKDHNACRYLEPNTLTHRKVPGRIKVCTRGLFFVPQDLQLPILRFPFRCMTTEPMAECFQEFPENSKASSSKPNDVALVYVMFQTKQVIEMRERGMDLPYVVKDTVKRTDGYGSNTQSRSMYSFEGEVPAKYMFTLQHVTYEAFLASIHILFEVSHLPRHLMIKIDEEALLAPVLVPRLTDKFDPSLLIDFRERLLMKTGCVVNRIEPLLKFPGCLMLTTQRLYFQPAPLNNVWDPVLNWEYTAIDQVYKRRYLLQQIGLEIYLQSGDSFFFSFQSRNTRNDLYALLVGQPELQRCQRKDLLSMMRKWQRRELSNLEYLQFLNNASGRTRNDLTQYPVFPWILQDFTSLKLDLNDPSVYRDLSKPIGALNQERLDYFKARYEEMPCGDEAEGMPPPFLYGTHYSTPGYVLYFLVRKVPEYMLCLQNGKFDAPDRLFRSIKGTWEGCVSNPTDVKELIPEFYDCALSPTEWLNNTKHLDLGFTQSFERIDDVELPPWAHDNAEEFVTINRAALESDYVSEHLHDWIDLIFGYKQQGDEAINANNCTFKKVFYYLSYEGSVDLDTINDSVLKRSLESQIQEFGQTPKLLFSTPHPSRNEKEGTIQIASPDLLLSPRVLIPHIRKISQTYAMMLETQPYNRNHATPSTFKDYAESDDDMELEKPTNDWESNSLNHFECFQTCWNFDLLLPLKEVSRQLWFHKMSRKPFKQWKWRSRLPTMYDFSPSWSWKQRSTYQLHQSEVTSAILTHENSYLFTTSKDQSLKLSSVENVTQKRIVSSKFALSCCDVSFDERVVFVGSWDNSVSMYSTSSGLVLDTIVAHSDGISAIRVLPGRILTSSWDSSIKLWRFTPFCIVKTPLRAFFECEESVLCLDVSRNGQYGAAGTRNGFVYLFNLQKLIFHNRRQVNVLHNGGVSSVVFAQDNRSYFCVNIQSEVSQFNLLGIKLWSMDIRTAGQIRCFDSDGEYAVGGTTAGTILMWRLHEPAGMNTVYEIPQAHAASISALTISSSGSILVSGAIDGSVNIWSLEKKQPLRRTSRSIVSKDLYYSTRIVLFNPIVQLAEADCCLEF
ncbi:hypothetical protein CCR75_001882 [Bremia lactucae]|uniref:Protein FAN n=1 Tax=Bremia lactucae TaxID=4779 RepID=A0A976FJB0_BRELC|nr:hypothetical protein CCR75_001882 [Bremia lactucae]